MYEVGFGNVFYVKNDEVWHVDFEQKRFVKLDKNHFIRYFNENPGGDVLRHYDTRDLVRVDNLF